MKNKDAISQAIVYLFEKEMFYAEIVAQMRRFNTPSIKTAGVCIKDDIELHINNDWFETLPIEQRAGVLKHECEHILRDHIVRLKEIAPYIYTKTDDLAQNIMNNMKHQSLNIAADCAVNSNINPKELPEWCVFAEKYKLQPGQTVEWYHEQLKKEDKNKPKPQPGDGHPEDGEGEGFPSHSLWGDSEGTKEVIKEKIKQAINKAAEKARSAGRMTSEQELLVSKLNAHTVNWKQQLSRFVARAIESTIESSKKKRNRRYGIMYPGSVKVEDLHIGVAIDTSGSVSDQALTQFMSEIGNIAKYAKVTVVEADSSVKNHYTYDPKKKYKVKGRGGTAYQPAFTWFTEETEVDAVIYFGDMDISDEVKKPKYPVLWAIVGNQPPPAKFGSEIRVRVANE